MSSWAPAAAVAACAWVALLAAAPLLPVAAAALLYAGGSLICHQLPDRSFYVDGFQLPVCARCFGLYTGGAIGAAAPLVTRPWRSGRGRYVVTALAALPTLATFTLEWGAGWPITNATRAVAAVPLGLTVAFVVVSRLATLHYDECAPPRPIGRGRPPATSI